MVCGGCNIENDVFVGANATIIQGVKIGMNSVIGAGSVVLADVPVNSRIVVICRIYMKIAGPDYRDWIWRSAA